MVRHNLDLTCGVFFVHVVTVDSCTAQCVLGW